VDVQCPFWLSDGTEYSDWWRQLQQHHL